MEKFPNKNIKMKDVDYIEGHNIKNDSNFIIETLEDDFIKLIKKLNLFKIIYSEFAEKGELEKFNKIKDLINESLKMLKDMEQGNKDILNKLQNNFKNQGIEEFKKKLKNDEIIKDEKDLDEIIKNILILTKKDNYYSDIKSLLYFLKLFNAEQTELSKQLNEIKLEFENIGYFNFDKLTKINNYLEKMNIYINNGKDSALIQFIRLLYNKKNEVNYLKSKETDITAALLYRLEPKIYSLKFNDILEYMNCINFIEDLDKEKSTDNNLIIKLKRKLAKNDINQVLSSFNCFFTNFEKFKLYESKNFYGSIKSILNNSIFEIKFFRKEFKVYDNNNKEIKDILAKDLDGLIQLKNNINLNYKDYPDVLLDKMAKELNEKKTNIEIFNKYIDNLQAIDKYILKLKNKGFPFFMEVQIINNKNNITYKLGNKFYEYDELISDLKEYNDVIKQYQLKFYEENEYFRYIYNRQIFRLLKRITNKNKDISSYIRFFTNSNPIKDNIPSYLPTYNIISGVFNACGIAINEKFNFVSKYIKHIFEINNTSLEKVYDYIKVKNNLNGIYKCFVYKYNMELFLVKIFFKLTGTFPIAQNILLTNNETNFGEITSFMYRAFKCKFNTLFIISINEDTPKQKIFRMKQLLNKMIKEMKKENNINIINPCILFIIQNELSNSMVFPEAIDLPKNLIGNENNLEYDLEKLTENEIYNHVRIYSSDCCGLGKSYLINKEIKEKGEEYFYFPIGDNITKDDLYKKLKKFLKHDIKGKNKVGIHLDLFYTKNISIMKYFLVSLLITKFYQVNDNILYIPKDINIYVEIPNGPFQFIDDYSLLTIFQRVNLTLDKQKPLDIKDENLLKNIKLDENQNNLTYLQKKIYINIINYLSKNKNFVSINNEKIDSLVTLFIENIYSKRIKERDISKKAQIENKKIDNLSNFFNFNEDDIKNEYKTPIIFNTKNEYLEINISDKEIKGKDMNYFILNLKRVMSLEKSEEEIKEIIGNYKITEDNYKKMILILFRLFANIPIILQGEAGCGKTELISILMKMINKDKENKNLLIKYINPNTKENEIFEVIEKAKENIFESKNDFICIFFQQINTSLFPSKIKEIFVNHSLNGILIDERIRFIGECLPFRKNDNPENIQTLYNPLPNSMLNYILYFKNIDDNNIKNYMKSILEEDFPQDKNGNGVNSIMKEIAFDMIYNSHILVKELNEISLVSLRDIQRFKKAYKFFNDYYSYKEEFFNNQLDNIPDKFIIKSKVQSLVLSLYITYFIRLFNPGSISKYLERINPDIKNLANKLDIKEWLDDNYWKHEPFKYIIKKEEDFLLNEMGIVDNNNKGISINCPLKENILVIFFSIYSCIPLIIVGKPGCSKSLSAQLIIEKMLGELSVSNFLKNYSSINATLFHGSKMNTSETIEKIFDEVENKIEIDTNTVLIFDYLDLTEKSGSHSLNILYNKFEMINKKNRISFIGISNSLLDPSIMNRVLFLSLSNLLLDDILSTAEAIANNFDNSLFKIYKRKYESLGTTYYYYKNNLKELNDEFIFNFHGNRDFYNIIKTFSTEMINNNKTDDKDKIEKAFKKSLERNLNGLEINGENSLAKYNSIINLDNINIFDCIKDNIASNDNRFILLISEKSMFNYIIDIMKNNIKQMNNNYIELIGSPFNEDKTNKSYNIDKILNIEKNVAEGKIIILSEFEQIYSIFYDLFNKNYIIKNGKKYYNIYYGTNDIKLSLINEKTKIFILIDKIHLRKQQLEFLDRFEKYYINFDIFLNEEEKEKSKIINNILGKIFSIGEINNNLKYTALKPNNNVINGYIHLYKNRENNSYRDIIKDIIIPILPQDIIFSLTLSEINNDIDKNYFDSLKRDIDLFDKYNSLEEYLNSDKIGKEYILIVYTFSKIFDLIQLNDNNNYLEIIAGGINCIFKLKKILKDFYENKNYKLLIIKFDNEDAKYINDFISEIKLYRNMNKINDNEKKFIFTVNIQREFDLNNNKNNKTFTAFIIDENIKQLFIDNINGAELTINELKKINIHDYINNNYKKIIFEDILIFFKENKNAIFGKYKGVNSNNFLIKFKSFMESNYEIIKIIKSLLLSQFDNNINISQLIIKNKLIDKNTIDFVSLMINYMNLIIHEKIKLLLRKTENNSFFTTIFILNIIEKEKEDNKPNSYYFNVSDLDILNNEFVKKIKNEFIKIIREEGNQLENNIQINIRLNYKIPGLYIIYQEIRYFIETEKLVLIYKQDETELRNCKVEVFEENYNKYKNDSILINEKLYNLLLSKKLLGKIIQIKTINKNYNEFIEMFLNDYITFYLEKIYNKENYNFEINDIQHRIILLLLDIKSQNLKEDEKYEKPIQNIISNILWLEVNSTYIKNIINIYNTISDILFHDEKDKAYLLNQIIDYMLKTQLKYLSKEMEFQRVNVPFNIIIILLFKIFIDESNIKKTFLGNNIEICLKEIKKLDDALNLKIIELSILNDFNIIYNLFDYYEKINALNKEEIAIKRDENEIKLLIDTFIKEIKNIKIILDNLIEGKDINGDVIYYELIANIVLNMLFKQKNSEIRFYIFKEMLLKDKKLYIQVNKILKKSLQDFVSKDINEFKVPFEQLSDTHYIIENINKNSTIKLINSIYLNESSSSLQIEEEKENEKRNDINNKAFQAINIKSFNLIEIKRKDCLKFIEKINYLIDLSNGKKVFFIYFSNDFWKILLNFNNEKNEDCISICFMLRKAFINYYNLINSLFDKSKISLIKKEADNYYDEFAFTLNQLIMKYINNNKELNDIKKLSLLTKYNPYYQEEKFVDKIDLTIFDSLELKNIDDYFIKDFKIMNFEKIFKSKIEKYINKFLSKIKSISDFCIIFKLINIKNISEKNIYLDELNKKYDDTIRNINIELLSDEKLSELIKVITHITLINFNFSIKEKKFSFIENNVNKLDKKNISSIFCEIIKKFIKKQIKEKEKEEEINIENDIFDVQQELKEYIFNEYSNKLEDIIDINNIINLFDCIKGINQIRKNEGVFKEKEIEEIINKNISEFLKKLIEKNLFNKNEFFLNKQNIKIDLLYELYKRGILKENNYYLYNEKICPLLEEINRDLNGNFKKGILEEFLKNEEQAIQRLTLIKLIKQNFNANEKYNEIKKKNDEINKDIEELKYIKDNIELYYKNSKKDLINGIVEVIKNNENKTINELLKIIKDKLSNAKMLKNKADIINKSKNFLLFKIIYKLNTNKEEDKKFDFSYDKLEEIRKSFNNYINIDELYKKYKDIFDKIKDSLNNNGDQVDKFINDLINFYNINNETLIDELIIFFKIEICEIDINSMIFFFNYFETNNKTWNMKLSEKYINISLIKDYGKIKEKLFELKNNKIYDFKISKNYYKIFTCLYEKKEAIDFLFYKTKEFNEELKDKIQPFENINITKNVINAEICILEIQKMKEIKENHKILNYIKSMNQNIIEQFINYSKVYRSIINFDIIGNNTENIYDKIYKIIQNSSIDIFQDSEQLLYSNNKKNIDINELIHLKNSIHIMHDSKDIENIEYDKYKNKCKILKFFKELLSKLERINNHIKSLRNIGNSLPIKISIKTNIQIHEQIAKYYLNDKEKSFDEIDRFLLSTKNNYLSILEEMYKNKIYLRFLYGKQFITFMEHLNNDNDINLDSILRYILNITDNDMKIIDENKNNIKNKKDWKNEYEKYYKYSLEYLSEYIKSLFKNNNSEIEKHYNKIKIIKDNKFKGIYFVRMEIYLMEKYIIKKFLDFTGQMPIAQNILFVNEETNIEEIKAFLCRAILCEYNTLFIVVIKPKQNKISNLFDFSSSTLELLQKKIVECLDIFLSYKNQKYNEEKKKNVEKKDINKYLNSCLFFVHHPIKNLFPSFTKEYDIKYDDLISSETNDIFENKNNHDYPEEFKKIKVISSDICGLGKSQYIIKKIKEMGKKYIYFPLGGELTRSIIYNKLQNLMKNIKNENYRDIAIHLDLKETSEDSILNEFLFCFLITKFYTNNDNIIYIPKKMFIYIEIPNIFSDYLTKFSILKMFNKEQISFPNIPEINLSPKDIDIFKSVLGFKTIRDINNFIKEKIFISKYSLHQVNIFIKLFLYKISNLNNSNIKIIKDGKNITEKIINNSYLCLQYFTNRVFSRFFNDENKK